MTVQESARALLKVAYKHIDPRTAVLNLDAFWKEVIEAQLVVFPDAYAKRNNAHMLLRVIERNAKVESLESLCAAIATHESKASYSEYLKSLATRGRLPVAVQLARQATPLDDMRRVVASLHSK